MFTKQLLYVFLAAGITSSGLARDKAAATPGTYQDWNDIDEVTIVQPAQGAGYGDVRVNAFDVSGVKPPAFEEGLRAKLAKNRAGSGRGKLVVRARVTKADPGSQAARYFGGFGAGAVEVEITGEIVDAGTNKTLARFKQERRSGVGAFGGGYSELFARTARQIGGDVASLVSAF